MIWKSSQISIDLLTIVMVTILNIQQQMTLK